MNFSLLLASSSNISEENFSYHSQKSLLNEDCKAQAGFISSHVCAFMTEGIGKGSEEVGVSIHPISFITCKSSKWRERK